MKWAIAIALGFGVIVIGFRFWGWLLTSFFVLNCLVLIIVVLLQSGKAADLAGAFGGAGSQTAFGPRGAATVLSQATTWCAVMFMVCAMAMALRSDRAASGSSVIYDRNKPAATKPAGSPSTTPVKPPTTSTPAPAPAPAAQTPKK
jgi:preprotein translocase subunit SecG